MENQAFDPKAHLQNIFYQTLQQSTQVATWCINWDSKEFSYISPAVEQLLGWKVSSWGDIQDWADRIHPNDRAHTVNDSITQTIAGANHEITYRAIKADGNHVWVRYVVHVVRNQQDVIDTLICYLFDVSQQQQRQDNIHNLQQQLNAFAYKDGLTGIANEHMFTNAFEREWKSAKRNQQPLSVILLDVDNFKQYNDLYGYLEADNTLKQVAHLLENVLARPRDLVARYKKDQFVLLLPETHAEAAAMIAKKCHQLIADTNIAHAASTVAKQLTISQGVNTIIPTHSDHPDKFIEETQKWLMAAKYQGKNRWCSSNEQD